MLEHSINQNPDVTSKKKYILFYITNLLLYKSNCGLSWFFCHMIRTKTIAYSLARLPIGMSFWGHGIIRLPKLNAFSEGMTNSFQDTLLPVMLVKPFSLVLPFIELLLGLALIIGFKARITSLIGVLLVTVLIFGSYFQENWSAIAIQMFYGAYLTVLYLFSEYNRPLLFKNLM